jgi:hypothetical protein
VILDFTACSVSENVKGFLDVVRAFDSYFIKYADLPYTMVYFHLNDADLFSVISAIMCRDNPVVWDGHGKGRGDDYIRFRLFYNGKFSKDTFWDLVGSLPDSMIIKLATSFSKCIMSAGELSRRTKEPDVMGGTFY